MSLKIKNKTEMAFTDEDMYVILVALEDPQSHYVSWLRKSSLYRKVLKSLPKRVLLLKEIRDRHRALETKLVSKHNDVLVKKWSQIIGQ
jgi:hypothetical protein